MGFPRVVTASLTLRPVGLVSIQVPSTSLVWMGDINAAELWRRRLLSKSWHQAATIWRAGLWW